MSSGWLSGLCSEHKAHPCISSSSLVPAGPHGPQRCLHTCTPSVASLAPGAGVRWILGGVEVGLFCDAHHPSGHGVSLSQSWASAAEFVTLQLRVTPELSIPVLGPRHSWALPLPWTFPQPFHAWMQNCSPAQGGEKVLGAAPVSLSPIPSLQLLCHDWGLEHILGRLRVPQSQGVL